MKYNKYSKYNDYELIYLIKDGNEKALNIMFKKYDTLIYTEILKVYHKNDKIDDLAQEGRMQLYECILRYNMNFTVSFYSYFLLCLKRKIYKLVYSEYYKLPIVSFCESTSEKFYDNNNNKIYLDDKYEQDMLDDCIINGFSIKEYATKHNMKYSQAYKIKKSVIEKVKAIINKDCK